MKLINVEPDILYGKETNQLIVLLKDIIFKPYYFSFANNVLSFINVKKEYWVSVSLEKLNKDVDVNELILKKNIFFLIMIKNKELVYPISQMKELD